MKTQTIVYVVGGLAVLGAAGAAIYFATKKPELTQGGAAPGGDTNPKPKEQPKQTTTPTYQASALPLELQSFANWVNQNSHLLDQEGNSV